MTKQVKSKCTFQKGIMNYFSRIAIHTNTERCCSANRLHILKPFSYIFLLTLIQADLIANKFGNTVIEQVNFSKPVCTLECEQLSLITKYNHLYSKLFSFGNIHIFKSKVWHSKSFVFVLIWFFLVQIFYMNFGDSVSFTYLFITF